MTIQKSSDKTLIDSLRILANEIQSGDGVANASIAEAADRLEELTTESITLGGSVAPFSKPFTNPASGMGIKKR